MCTRLVCPGKKMFAAVCNTKKKLAKGSGGKTGGVFVSAIAPSSEAAAKRQIPGWWDRDRRGGGTVADEVVGQWQTRWWDRDRRGGGTATDEVLGCGWGQDLWFKKLLHLLSAPTASPRNSVSQRVRRWHLLQTEPSAAPPGEQVKAHSPPRNSPAPCAAHLLSWACRSSSLDSICPGLQSLCRGTSRELCTKEMCCRGSAWWFGLRSSQKVNMLGMSKGAAGRRRDISALLSCIPQPLSGSCRQ